MCEEIRHGRVNLLRDQGAYFGKSSKGWFFGFKLHVLTTLNGKIIGACLTNGNTDDRDGARILAQYLEEGSLCVADLGYRGDGFQTELFEEEGAAVSHQSRYYGFGIKKSSFKNPQPDRNDIW
jgi:hypothetical protein